MDSGSWDSLLWVMAISAPLLPPSFTLCLIFVDCCIMYLPLPLSWHALESRPPWPECLKAGGSESVKSGTPSRSSTERSPLLACLKFYI